MWSCSVWMMSQLFDWKKWLVFQAKMPNIWWFTHSNARLFVWWMNCWLIKTRHLMISPCALQYFDGHFSVFQQSQYLQVMRSADFKSGKIKHSYQISNRYWHICWDLVSVHISTFYIFDFLTVVNQASLICLLGLFAYLVYKTYERKG